MREKLQTCAYARPSFYGSNLLGYSLPLDADGDPIDPEDRRYWRPSGGWALLDAQGKPMCEGITWETFVDSVSVLVALARTDRRPVLICRTTETRR